MKKIKRRTKPKNLLKIGRFVIRKLLPNQYAFWFTTWRWETGGELLLSCGLWDIAFYLIESNSSMVDKFTMEDITK